MLSDKILRTAYVTSFFLFLSTVLIFAVAYHLLPPLVPIFNQMPWGQNRVGQKLELVIPLGITALIIIGNFITTTYLYQKLPLVSRMVAVSSIFSSLLLFLFLLRTLFVVLY